MRRVVPLVERQDRHVAVLRQIPIRQFLRLSAIIVLRAITALIARRWPKHERIAYATPVSRRGAIYHALGHPNPQTGNLVLQPLHVLHPPRRLWPRLVGRWCLGRQRRLLGPAGRTVGVVVPAPG